MMTLNQLYERANLEGIEIDERQMQELQAAAFPEGWVVIDPTRFESMIAFKCALAHEIGHIETGSFYNIWSPFDLMAKCEYKANRRASEMLMPLHEVQSALRAGHSSRYALAVYFEVTEEFADIALAIYGDLLRVAT